MAKPTTIKIRLNSTADTGHFYVTKKKFKRLRIKYMENRRIAKFNKK